MDLWFEHLPGDYYEGAKILSDRLGISINKKGIPVSVEQRVGDIEVSMANGKGLIRFDKKVQFFRALGLFVELLKDKNEFKITEVPQFNSIGAMFDVSRNCVLSVESIKRLISIMALMGFNLFIINMADIYEIRNKPYFGYMRGRYNYDELKECDDYANYFGIEIIPCIQTLGHLKHALKWRYADNIKDTDDILLVGEEKTYDFIEEMIKSVSAPFRSNRIHLGMDEAENLGLGNYLKRNGFRRRFDILREHLERVLRITTSYGLEPMIWSDMYFKLASRNEKYYDEKVDFPKDVIAKIPDELQFVYWDYYHDDEKMYIKMIKKHKELKENPIFAGGIWTWQGLTINYGKTFVTTKAALNACKKEGVREVFATLWQDESETNMFAGLLGLQLYAEYGYFDNPDLERISKRFKFCTGGDFNAFYSLTYIDEIPGTEKDNLSTSNPSKLLLYQDLLLSLFDRNFLGMEKDIIEHYHNLNEKIKKYKRASKEWDFVFDVPERLCSVLELKIDLWINIRSSYLKKDRNSLNLIVNEKLPLLKKRLNALRKAHRSQWFKTYKPFGWEVLDIRYGGIIARIDSSIERIKDYLNGVTNRIEELEEKRLYFRSLKDDCGNSKYGRVNKYHRIVTAGKFTVC